MIFLKTRFYPVNYDTKEIIDLPCAKERTISCVLFRGKGFIGIKGKRLNEHACYREFTVRQNDFKITGEKLKL